jgi:hypothetical protein
LTQVAEVFPELRPDRYLTTKAEFGFLGDMMGDLLLSGSVLQLYTTVSQRVLFDPEQGLRLKLHFVGDAGKYRRLPWELVRINGKYLALDPRQSIVRTVDLLEPSTALRVEEPPYRLLIVFEGPKDGPQLQFEHEERTIRQALDPLSGQGLVEIRVLRDITVAQLEQVLREGEFLFFTFRGIHRLME